MTLSLLRNSCTWAYLLPSPSVGVRVSFVDVEPIISRNCCLRTCIWGGPAGGHMTLLNIMGHKSGVSMWEGVMALVISMQFDTLLCDAAVSTQLVSDKVEAHSTCVKDAAKTAPETALSGNKVFMKFFLALLMWDFFLLESDAAHHAATSCQYLNTCQCINTSVFNSNNLTNNFLLILQH